MIGPQSDILPTTFNTKQIQIPLSFASIKVRMTVWHKTIKTCFMLVWTYSTTEATKEDSKTKKIRQSNINFGLNKT